MRRLPAAALQVCDEPAVRALVRGEVRDVHTARAAARGYRSGEFFSDAEGELGVVGPEPVRRFDRTVAR